MKIIITGATGSVGAHMVRHFSSLDHEVIATGRQKKPPRIILDYAQWKQVDITQKIKSLDADVIIHCAGMATDKGTFLDFQKTNVEGSLNTYLAFTGNHFIQISSASVYSIQNFALREENTDSISSNSYYGKSKLEAENALLHLDKKSKLTILRPRAIYGTHDRVLLPRMLNLLKKDKIRVPGKLDIKISMTHISNLIHAVELAMTNQRSKTAVYNVSDRYPYMLSEVLTKLLTLVYDKSIIIKPLPIYPIHLLCKITDMLNIPFPLTEQSLQYLSKSCILDISKIKSELCFEPKANFCNNLTDIHTWIRKVGLDYVKSSAYSLPWDGISS